MDKKRVVWMNLAVVGAVLLLAVMAFLLPEVLPDREITPNAGTLEEAGFEFTPGIPAD